MPLVFSRTTRSTREASGCWALRTVCNSITFLPAGYGKPSNLPLAIDCELEMLNRSFSFNVLGQKRKLAGSRRAARLDLTFRLEFNNPASDRQIKSGKS